MLRTPAEQLHKEFHPVCKSNEFIGSVRKEIIVHEQIKKVVFPRWVIDGIIEFQSMNRIKL